jgi:hypothetical protein
MASCLISQRENFAFMTVLTPGGLWVEFRGLECSAVKQMSAGYSRSPHTQFPVIELGSTLYQLMTNLIRYDIQTYLVCEPVETICQLHNTPRTVVHFVLYALQ